MARLLLLYYGYTQYFIWAAILECLSLGALVPVSSKIRLRSPEFSRIATTYILSWTAVALLGLPLLLPQYQQAAHSFTRASAVGASEFKDLAMHADAFWHGLLFPLSAGAGARLGGIYEGIYHVSHVALPLVFLALGALPVALLRRAEARSRILLRLAGLSLFSYAISANWFYIVLYFTPVFNRFRWPFKLQIFTSFFLVCAGAAALCLFRDQLRGRFRTALVVVAMVGTVTDFVAIDVMHRPHGWIDQPPVLQKDALVDRVRGGRVFSVGYRPWFVSNILRSRTLGYAYAHLWGYDDLGGYDPWPCPRMRTSPWGLCRARRTKAIRNGCR